MIYTLTMNPSLDYYLIVNSDLIRNEVNRAEDTIYKVGGKGLNVSMVLDAMDLSSHAITMLGGVVGSQIRAMMNQYQNIELDVIQVEETNRLNVKILSESDALSVNAKGIHITKLLQDEIINKLANITEDDWVLLCGSMVNQSNESFVQDVASHVHRKNAKLVIDMESITLEMIEETKPFLIKPNLYEFGLIMNTDITLETIDAYITEVLTHGLKSILVSLGKEGAIYANSEMRVRLTQPEIKAINNVGTGDAMLAMFVGNSANGVSPEESLKLAGAAGCLTAMSLESIKKECVEEFSKEMKTELYHHTEN